jgi:hypothetical protein
LHLEFLRSTIHRNNGAELHFRPLMFSTWVRCSSGSRIVAVSTAGSLRFSGLVTAAGLTPATSRMVRRQSPFLRFSAAPSPKLRSIAPTPPSPLRLHQRTSPCCRCCSSRTIPAVTLNEGNPDVAGLSHFEGLAWWFMPLCCSSHAGSRTLPTVPFRGQNGTVRCRMRDRIGRACG